MRSRGPISYVIDHAVQLDYHQLPSEYYKFVSYAGNVSCEISKGVVEFDSDKREVMEIRRIYSYNMMIGTCIYYSDKLLCFLRNKRDLPSRTTKSHWYLLHRVPPEDLFFVMFPFRYIVNLLQGTISIERSGGLFIKTENQGVIFNGPLQAYYYGTMPESIQSPEWFNHIRKMLEGKIKKIFRVGPIMVIATEDLELINYIKSMTKDRSYVSLNNDIKIPVLLANVPFPYLVLYGRTYYNYLKTFPMVIEKYSSNNTLNGFIIMNEVDFISQVINTQTIMDKIPIEAFINYREKPHSKFKYFNFFVPLLTNENGIQKLYFSFVNI